VFSEGAPEGLDLAVGGVPPEDMVE